MFHHAGRGEQVIEDHLIENCKFGRVSSAILDVYCRNLPKNSKLWNNKI